MLLDLRQALASLSRARAFAAVVVLILGLGIGVNTAIFSVVRAVLLRPLPFQEPERLVRLYESFLAGGDQERLALAPLTWQRWRESNDVFDDIGAATGTSLTLGGAGEPAQYVASARVSHNFFDVLGVRAWRGRDFLEEEDRPGAPPVVMLGYGLWQRRFGGADVVGRDVLIDGVPHTIVGVMPEAFRHPYRAELWVPLALRIDPVAASGRFLYAPARLKRGISVEQARRSLAELCARIEKEHPSPANARQAAVVPLHSAFVSEIRPKMLAITAAAAFVLLIAGANVASLLLVRIVEREPETALRAALGASRARIARRFLLESLWLTSGGIALGVALAAALTDPLYALSPLASDASGSALREFDHAVRIDLPVLLASIAVALAVGVSAGLLAAWRASRRELTVATGLARRSTLDRGTRRTFAALVVWEIAMAGVLLTATGLVVRSFRHLVGEEWGFGIEQRLAFNVSFSERLRPEHRQRVAYVEQALERLRALPGVISATATTPDIVNLGRGLAGVSPAGSPPPEPRGYFLVNHRMVFPGYFESFGIRIVKGRGIERADTEATQRVAVVSEGFARRHWPGGDPIGKSIKRGRPDDTRPSYVVAGVAADVKGVPDPTDGEVPGTWYLAYPQNPGFLTDDLTFVVHAGVPAPSLERPVRQLLTGVDPTLAPYDFTTVERLADTSYVQDRFAALLVGLFGGLGLLLSALGLYGLLSFQVARRTRELGVRAALGARQGDIVSLVLRDGALLVVPGLGLGLLGALAVTRLLGSQLHGVQPTDPLSYAAAAIVLSLAAALASWLPARRAARVEPTLALRSD